MTEQERKRKLKEDRERRADLKRPRDPTLWHAYLVHVVQGVIAGGLAVLAIFEKNLAISIFAALMVWQYLQYQHSSFLLKRDPVGRDIRDFGYGFGIGSLATFFWLYLK